MDLYKIERMEKDIAMAQATAVAMERDVCEAACRACPQYGRVWTCPPFMTDSSAVHPESFERLLLVVSRITFSRRPLPGCDVEVFHKVKKEVLPYLRDIARSNGGTLYGFAGRCDQCATECARIQGQPCRHPDLVGPSLEGVGFNVGNLLDRFFGISLEWSSQTHAAHTLTFVAGVAYNR